MSLYSGETESGNQTSRETPELTRQQLENQLMLDALGSEFGPRQRTRFANGNRDFYFEFGDPENMQVALIYYEKALAGLTQDDALRSWILCNRLSLYAYEYKDQRFDRTQLLDEIDFAMESGKDALFRDRGRVHKDHLWLLAIRASVRNDVVMEGANRDAETQRMRHLSLVVGDVASEDLVAKPVLIPEVKPELA